MKFLEMHLNESQDMYLTRTFAGNFCSLHQKLLFLVVLYNWFLNCSFILIFVIFPFDEAFIACVELAPCYLLKLLC